MSNGTDHGDKRAQALKDAELVADVRRGRTEAFDKLVARYQRQANAVAWRLLSNRDDAMETVQDAFLKAFARLDSLDEPERFGSWLLRIVSNLALNRRRGRALRRMAPLEGARDDDENAPIARADEKAETPLEQAVGRDMRDWMRNAIDALPDKQRQALILFSIQKLPQKQVAEILDCSVEAVKWHVFTARKKLREKLDEMS